MAPASPPRHVGILVLELLKSFRIQLLEQVHARGFTDLRSQHLQVLGYIDPGGTRLTQIAERANVGAPAIAQSVSELEAAGYVQRCSDLSDGRAKLVFLTDKGMGVTTHIHSAIKRIDADYSSRVGAKRYSAMRSTLADLRASLSRDES